MRGDQATAASIERAANCLENHDVDVHNALGAPENSARQAREAQPASTQQWKDWAE